MSNLLKYTDKSKTIDNKITSLLAQIEYDHNNGNIRTEIEYYYRIKNMLNEFYKSLTKPTFTFRPAVNTPISSEYNSMITESYNDMQYIIKDCEALGNLVSQSFIDAQLNRDMLNNELTYLSKKVSSIGDSLSSSQVNGTVVFTDLFNDLEQCGNVGDSNACYVNTADGILTLKRGSVSKPVINKVEIDSNVSNGFPGNTHCVDTLSNGLHFVGQDGMHMSIDTIFDNQKDTWFEFEIFNIDDDVRKQCNSFGFDYEEGVSWVTEDNKLKLKLIAYLNSSVQCSWVTVTPYLSGEKGVKGCILESCDVITSSNNVYRVCENKSFDDVLVFPFPPQKVQRIEFTFVQPFRYSTKVGHFYFTSTNTENMSIFQNYDYVDMYSRVDGEKPSVSLLNCKYNPTTKWIDYNSENILSSEYIKTGLFKAPSSTIEKRVNEEIINAYRYMIGIRDISLSTCIFNDYGEYVSVVMKTNDVITSITLYANEYIPGNNDEILQYFISLNGGITWHKIYPVHRAYKGIYKYYVNDDTIANALSNNPSDNRSKNLSIIGEPKSIQLKITMNRPTDIEEKEYSSPIVYDYKLKLTVGGETIEY